MRLSSPVPFGAGSSLVGRAARRPRRRGDGVRARRRRPTPGRCCSPSASRRTRRRPRRTRLRPASSRCAARPRASSSRSRRRARKLMARLAADLRPVLRRQGAHPARRLREGATPSAVVGLGAGTYEDPLPRLGSGGLETTAGKWAGFVILIDVPRGALPGQLPRRDRRGRRRRHGRRAAAVRPQGLDRPDDRADRQARVQGDRRLPHGLVPELRADRQPAGRQRR